MVGHPLILHFFYHCRHWTKQCLTLGWIERVENESTTSAEEPSDDESSDQESDTGTPSVSDDSVATTITE